MFGSKTTQHNTTPKQGKTKQNRTKNNGLTTFTFRPRPRSRCTSVTVTSSLSSSAAFASSSNSFGLGTSRGPYSFSRPDLRARSSFGLHSKRGTAAPTPLLLPSAVPLSLLAPLISTLSGSSSLIIVDRLSRYRPPSSIACSPVKRTNQARPSDLLSNHGDRVAVSCSWRCAWQKTLRCCATSAISSRGFGAAFKFLELHELCRHIHSLVGNVDKCVRERRGEEERGEEGRG